MPHSACLIAHGAKIDHDTIAEALAASGIEDQSVDVRLTSDDMSARDIAQRAVVEGVERIVAIGGDGTVNEVVDGMFRDGDASRRRPALGIVPLGTANDLANFLGIPSELPRALHIALIAAPRMVDVGVLGERHFLNVVTGGVMSEASANLHPELKSKLGTFAYTLAGLVSLPSVEAIEVSASTPTESWSGRILAIAVGNARTAAGGFELCPDARMDDGELDLTLVPADIDKLALAGMLLSRSVAEIDQVVRMRGPRIHLRADRAINLNADGEPLEMTSVEIGVMRHALALCVPEGSPGFNAEPDVSSQA